MENTTRQQKIQTWAGILVSLVCLAGIFIFIDEKQVLEAFRNARYGYVVLTVLGILAFLLLRAIRWRFMLNNAPPYSPIFHIQNIGYMLTNLLPLRLGDVARGVLIGNVPPVTLSQGISTMVMERILDLLFIVTLLPFAFSTLELGTVPAAEAERIQSLARTAGYIALAGTIVLIVAANMRPLTRRIATAIFDRLPFLNTNQWVKVIDDLLLGLTNFTKLRDGVILIALSIITWLPIIAAYYSCMLAVNIEPTIPLASFAVCAAALSIAAPSSPGQVGVFHAGVIFALTLVGQPEEKATAFAFLYHALNFSTMTILGIIGLRGIGSTWANVVETARSFRRKQVELPTKTLE